jgi:Tetratricopeptide repeat
VARPLLERALAIRKKMLGPEHHDTATSFSNLGRLLNKANHASDAEPLLPIAQAALATNEAAHGPNHLWTKDSRSRHR